MIGNATHLIDKRVSQRTANLMHPKHFILLRLNTCAPVEGISRDDLTLIPLTDVTGMQIFSDGFIWRPGHQGQL